MEESLFNWKENRILANQFEPIISYNRHKDINDCYAFQKFI